MPDQSYFELVYEPPWKGINVDLPENKIDKQYTPKATNWIPRSGELRTRPRQSQFLSGFPDGSQPTAIHAFADSNNIVHTIAISTTGLWQLNPGWRQNPTKTWNQIGRFTNPYSVSFIPPSIQIFLDQLYFVIGDSNVWNWDGIAPSVATGLTIRGLVTFGNFIVGEQINQLITAATAKLKLVSSGYISVTNVTGSPDATHQWIGQNSQAVFTPTSAPSLGVNALQSIAIYDTTNNLSAGAFFLGELDSRLVILNTTEQQNAPGKPLANFPQRIRWSASGLPSVWDQNVNGGAGYNDELDVPDQITGFLTIGRNGFVFRVNGITEMTSISQGLLPFDFNHLWASDRGIGNVYPFSIAGYGPVGVFISNDDVYELSLGGFRRIGGLARNAIFADIGKAIATPVASMFPTYNVSYPYLTYKLSIPLAGNTNQIWCYFTENDSWFPWTEIHGFETGRTRMVPTS